MKIRPILPQRRRAEPSRAALVACALACAVAAPAAADDAESGSGLFHRGSVQLAVVGGWGEGFRFAKSGNNPELDDVGLVNVIGRLGFGLTDPVGVGSWYHGNLELLLEGAFLYNTDPRSGAGGTGGTAFRYNFLSFDRVVPFVDMFAGLGAIDFDLKGQSDGFNFNIGAGVGSHWFVADRAAFTTEVRYQHLSNAGTKSPNHGINDVLFLGGFTFFF